MLTKIALVAAVILPLWNIPLIMKIIRRTSSKDISLAWALGVWVCLLAMFPAGIASSDIVWKTFNIANIVLFSGVVVTTLLFRETKQ
jgi:hypothetical protein